MLRAIGQHLARCVLTTFAVFVEGFAGDTQVKLQTCSFTSKDRDLRMLSARLTKLESTRLRAHDDVLFDRLQILLGSPLSMLCFIIGWFVLFLERK